MGEREREIVEDGGAIGRIARPRRQRQSGAFQRQCPKDAVDKPGRTALPHAPHQFDRVVDDGGGRDACEVEQLIRAQAQDGQHFGIEAIDLPRPRHPELEDDPAFFAIETRLRALLHEGAGR